MFGRDKSTDGDANATGTVDAVVVEPGEKKGHAAPVNGVPMASYEFRVEVRPDGAAPEQVTVTGNASPMCLPPVGATIRIHHKPGKKSGTFDVAGDPNFDPAGSKKRAMDRLAATREKAADLNEHGTHGIAHVTGYEVGPQLDGLSLWTSHVHVTTDDGQEFDSAVIIDQFSTPSDEMLDSLKSKPQAVVFDPADRSRVAWQVKHGPSVKWRVPEKCPQCGAPVDQATASQADSPTCEFCHAPLPATSY